MGLLKLFHKIKISCIRRQEVPIPPFSPQKQYGSYGEDEFAYEMEHLLPDCRMKRNIIIESDDGDAEIDFLILYRRKLFAVEVKRWSGTIEGNINHIKKEKVDKWTGEIYTETPLSPFVQLKRAVYLLKKQQNQKVWINTIVFFEDADTVRLEGDDVWFTEIKELAEYIKCGGESSYSGDTAKFFNNCRSADYLYTYIYGIELRCIIRDSSLVFDISGRRLTRRDIDLIDITHRRTYDILNIKARDGESYTAELENGFVEVTDSGRTRSYALSKIERIKLG